MRVPRILPQVTDFAYCSDDDRDPRIARLLRAYGIMPTAQRIEIAEVLLRKTRHLSAEQVLEELRGQTPVSKATVYNSLKLSAERGLIRQVNLHSERVIYDSNTRPHHHFYNVDTGELTDIDPEHVRIEGLPSPPGGTVTEGVEIVIRVRHADTD